MKSNQTIPQPPIPTQTVDQYIWAEIYRLEELSFSEETIIEILGDRAAALIKASKEEKREA